MSSCLTWNGTVLVPSASASLRQPSSNLISAHLVNSGSSTVISVIPDWVDHAVVTIYSIDSGISLYQCTESGDIGPVIEPPVVVSNSNSLFFS